MIQRFLTLVAMLLLAACAKDEAPAPAEAAPDALTTATIELHFSASPGSTLGLTGCPPRCGCGCSS